MGRIVPTIEEVMGRGKLSVDGCLEWQGALQKQGYGSVKFSRKHWLVHRLSYAYTHGGIPKGLQVQHLCNNTKCFNPSHLTVGTHTENIRYAVLTNNFAETCVRGEDNHKAKLSYNDVRDIRRLRDQGATLVGIAEKFEVAHSTVGRACSRKTWAHVA